MQRRHGSRDTSRHAATTRRTYLPARCHYRAGSQSGTAVWWHRRSVWGRRHSPIFMPCRETFPSAPWCWGLDWQAINWGWRCHGVLGVLRSHFNAMSYAPCIFQRGRVHFLHRLAVYRIVPSSGQIYGRLRGPLTCETTSQGLIAQCRKSSSMIDSVGFSNPRIIVRTSRFRDHFDWYDVCLPAMLLASRFRDPISPLSLCPAIQRSM